MGSYEVLESRAISASISSELWTSSTIAITLALLAIFAYILIRFGHWQYSLGAVAALAHDVIIVLGAFSSFTHALITYFLSVNGAKEPIQSSQGGGGVQSVTTIEDMAEFD